MHQPPECPAGGRSFRAELGRELLVQGDDNKQKLLAQFTEHGRAVLGGDGLAPSGKALMCEGPRCRVSS